MVAAAAKPAPDTTVGWLAIDASPEPDMPVAGSAVAAMAASCVATALSAVGAPCGTPLKMLPMAACRPLGVASERPVAFAVLGLTSAVAGVTGCWANKF